jgi:hypothetical protein
MIGQYRGKRLFAGRLFSPRLFGPAPIESSGAGGFRPRPWISERFNDDDEVLLLIASVIASGILG